MKIEQNKSLTTYTTFAVEVKAKYFVEISKISEIYDLVSNSLWNQEDHYILGGGSNVLFIKDFDGIVVYNNLKGIEIIHKDENHTIRVKVLAGENWHDFVMWSVDRNLWGVENLILIPGTVGAAPVQNIGAYGVEVKDTIVSVEAIDLVSGEILIFSNDDCDFSYRMSIFKKEPQYFITSVTFELSKTPNPHIGYASLKEKLETNNITSPTVEQIAKTIITIRQSKLPHPDDIGTAGSFFKNPIIPKEQAQKLLKEYPKMRYFNLPNNQVKIPAAWLIDTLGYKGVKEGNVGTYNKHALVLINYGDATGEEVWKFAQKIIHHVYKVFGIMLEPEVLII